MGGFAWVSSPHPNDSAFEESWRIRPGAATAGGASCDRGQVRCSGFGGNPDFFLP